MTRDLGAGGAQVHRAAAAVLRFWLEETPPDRWFARDAALDRAIAQRFAPMRAAVVASDAADWRDDPRALLAAVILIDQFGRNIFRGEGEAFAADGLARALADLAVARGWDAAMPAVERQFLYLPFMHGEDMTSQARSVALFAALAMPEQHRYALAHRDQIARFGRFPGRNAALGRASTPDEQAALEAGAAF